MTGEETLKQLTDIEKCRRRNRVYSRLLKNKDLDFNNLTAEEKSYIEFAIRRSWGIEQMNIALLKKYGEDKNERTE